MNKIWQLWTTHWLAGKCLTRVNNLFCVLELVAIVAPCLATQQSYILREPESPNLSPTCLEREESAC
jgi:hypothetical protein